MLVDRRSGVGGSLNRRVSRCRFPVSLLRLDDETHADRLCGHVDPADLPDFWFSFFFNFRNSLSYISVILFCPILCICNMAPYIWITPFSANISSSKSFFNKLDFFGSFFSVKDLFYLFFSKVF